MGSRASCLNLPTSQLWVVLDLRERASLAQNTVLADLHLDLDSDARIVHGMLHLRQRPSASAVDVAWIGGGGTADLESDEGL